MNTPRSVSRNHRATGRSGPLFGICVVLWILFAAALIFDQSALDSAWNWLTGLPLLVQLVVWVMLLPITLGLWIWEADWALWTRVLLIIALGVGNLATFDPRNRTRNGQNPGSARCTRSTRPGKVDEHA